MIENIRKYTGLIIVTIVVLLLGFIFMDTSSFFRQSATGGTFATVDGRGYSQTEFINLGSAPMELSQGMGDPGMFRLTSSLAGNPTSEENMRLNFFAGRILLQDAREKFGVHPSDEDVQEYIQQMRAFQSRPPIGSPPGTQGEFDQSLYNEFMQNQIGRFGLVERDFQDLVRDVIAASKLREIIGGGLTGSRELAKAQTVMNAQQIEAEVADVDAKVIREGIKPTDEELKEYWETLKDAYQTEKRVKVSYLLAGPIYSDDAKEPTEENPAEGEEKSEEEKTAEAAAKAERADKRKEQDKAFTASINTFITQVIDSEGEKFEELINEQKDWELVSTDWITETSLPTDLALKTRGISSGKTIADNIFRELATGPDPLAPYTGALAVGTNQWLIARLDELEDPRTKTFEEAKEEITERYINEKVDEALRNSVEEQTKALEEAIAGGKSFEEAAKALELTPRKLGPWGVSDTLDNEFHGREIFQLASTVTPGEFADPLIQENRGVIILVTKREIIKDDNRGAQYDRFTTQLEVQNENAAFASWMAQRLAEAQVSGPAAR